MLRTLVMLQPMSQNLDKRVDSRLDYYYRAHRESPECIEFYPTEAPSDGPIHYVNEIEYDDKPRLVNKFTAHLGDIHGCHNPMIQEKSREGVWNLGRCLPVIRLF